MPQARKQTVKRDRHPDRLAEAMEAERALFLQAAGIRGEAIALDYALLDKLYPLLCAPIPAGYIETVGKVEGKMYETTGIRSAQVQIDRLNNVLRPWWWGYVADYNENGTTCKVTVAIGSGDNLLLDRWSYG